MHATVESNLEFLRSVAMRQYRTLARSLQPHIHREVLFGKRERSLSGSSQLLALHGKRRIVGNFRSVEHTGYLEVAVVAQCSLHDFLIKGHAYIVSDVQDAVGRLWQSERFRFHHILCNQYLVAGACHFVSAV